MLFTKNLFLVIFSHENVFNCAFGGREIINIVFKVPRDQGVWGDTMHEILIIPTLQFTVYMYCFNKDVIRIIGA